MYCCDPAAANTTVVVTRLAGTDRDLGRARAVDRFRAGPVALVDRGVADDPLVVDRVAVVDRERDRHAERHDHRARLVLRVVDLDRDRRVVAAGELDPGPGHARHAQRERDAADQGERPWSAAGTDRGFTACRSGHLDRRPASDQQQDAADAADAERQARAAGGPPPRTAKVPGRAGHVQAGHDPRRLRAPRSRRPRGRTRAARAAGIDADLREPRARRAPTPCPGRSAGRRAARPSPARCGRATGRCRRSGPAAGPACWSVSM